MSVQVLLVIGSLLVCSAVMAQSAGHAEVNYDESRVPAYTLPDVFLTLDGHRVTDARAWREKRRSEILGLFATNVYGRTMIGRPNEMTWKVLTTKHTVVADTNGSEQPAILKTVAIYFAGRKDGPKMILEMALPVLNRQRAPAFLVPAGSSQFQKQVVNRGYALVNFDIKSIEPDATNGYSASVRAFFAAPGQTAAGADEWGAIGAWAWGASRALDYLITDPDIDPHKICIQGLSRWGKVAMWAGAQDERFAIVFSCESGCGGAVLVRRQLGETVKAITSRFPHWFDGNFATFGDRVNDLPVDWHMLIALMAPRPVYIATAEDDAWGDPHGSFLAAKAAEPVYRLFGKNGLGVDEMPKIETPVGDTIGFHERRGKHAINEYDWDQFLNFADRHLGNPFFSHSLVRLKIAGQYRNPHGRNCTANLFGRAALLRRQDGSAVLVSLNTGDLWIDFEAEIWRAYLGGAAASPSTENDRRVLIAPRIRLRLDLAARMSKGYVLKLK